ncbi:MAG TPA: lysylphosphatidylglycerol synthase domain-containing protein [Chitinophagales bacterium]|nr:lysylphosphatidylglycerol synthase domain-containing protein [Chitinophagales bacterium]
MNDKLAPKLLFALKLALFALLAWFVVNRLFVQNDFKAQWGLFTANIGGHWYLLATAVLLMPLNWLLETSKWQILLKTATPFKTLLKSVVAGITIGFVTPGRTGEFIGRTLFMETDGRTKVFYLSSIGGFAQTAASLLVGTPFVYLWHNNPRLSALCAGFAAIYSLVFFRFDLLNRLIARIPLLHRYGLLFDNAHLPDISTQVSVLLLSALRFMVYLSQYILLLSFFGISASFFTLATHSVVYLLAQTFSPLMPALDISFRAGTALYVFGGITTNNLAVLSAITGVWLLNLVIPALAGYWFILRHTGFKYLYGKTGF